MSNLYLGPLVTARQAKAWRSFALEIGETAIASWLTPERWQAVAARPKMAEEIYRKLFYDKNSNSQPSPMRQLEI